VANQLDTLQLLDSGFLRSPSSADNIQSTANWEFQSDVVIDANLTVSGTTTTSESEINRYADNHLYLNDGYTTVSAQTGGLVVNYLPIATSDTVNGSFTAGVAATSNPTVVTTGSGTFAVGQFIQISGANDPSNNGLFEVLTHTGTTLTIRGVGTTAEVEDFTQNQFVTDATVAGTITRVNVSILRAGTDGVWETGVGATTGISFTDLGTGSGNSLQQAYVQGNQITTSGGEGDVIIAGTESFQITATNGLNVDTLADFDVTTFDVQMTGSNGFSIDGTAASNVSVTAGALTVSTITSGDLNVTSIDSVVVTGNEAIATAIQLNAANAAGGVDIDAGTGGVAVDTTGPLSLDSTGTAANLTLTANDAGTSTLVISSTNAGAGVGNLDVDADGSVDILAGGIFSIDGTGASNVSATSGALTLSTITSGDLNVTSIDSVVITGNEAIATAIQLNAANAAGGIDIDAGTGGVAVDTTGPLSLDGTGTAANLTLAANDAGTATLVLAASNVGAGVGNLDVDADGSVDILAGGVFSIDGTGVSNVTATSGNLTVSTVTSGSLLLTSAGDSTYTVPDPSATAFTLTDGTSNYVVVDSTAGFEALDLDQHINLVEGAGIELDTSASTSLVAGDLVSLDAGGDLTLSDANNGSLRASVVVGVSRGTFGTATTAQIFTVPGSLIPVRFTSAPAAANNGSRVFLSNTAGQATLTAPSGTNTVTYQIGWLQGANGASTTPDVIFHPMLINQHPSVTVP